MVNQFPLLHPVLDRCFYYTQSVNRAVFQIYARRIMEVFGWAGNFCNIVTGTPYLGEHLIVEHKIIGVRMVVDPLQHLPGKCPVSGVVFR